MRETVTVPTENGRRYLGQFVKHFSHKLPFALHEGNERGEVNFPFGLCTLEADAKELRLFISAQTEADAATLKDVAARHLLRFAHREELALDWRATESS